MSECNHVWIDESTAFYSVWLMANEMESLSVIPCLTSFGAKRLNPSPWPPPPVPKSIVEDANRGPSGFLDWVRTDSHKLSPAKQAFGLAAVNTYAVRVFVIEFLTF